MQSKPPAKPVVADPKLLAPDSTARRPTRLAIILWLIAVGMGFFFMPLYFFTTALQDDTRNLETELGSLRVALTSVPTPLPEARRVLTPLALTQSQVNQLGAIAPTLSAPRPDWQRVMRAIGNYDPRVIEINSLTQAGNTITIGGSALREDVTLDYIRALEQSNLFARVNVLSLQVASAPSIATARPPTILPTAAPTWTLIPSRTAIPSRTPFSIPATAAPVATLTATPTFTPTITPSPTPDVRDQYEPDDVSFAPIFFGVSQLHNFFPRDDVDTVSFLAKNGRFYRVFSTELVPGVDTFFTLRVGASVMTNDDDPERPGTLASKISFQNTSGADQTANLTIVNRGEYGSDKWYKLIAEEYLPTPTVTPSATATASPSPTATATPSPTVTPSPTTTPIFTLTPTTMPTKARAENSFELKLIAARENGIESLDGLRDIWNNPPKRRVLGSGRNDIRDRAQTLTVKFVIVLELKPQ
ncbi:MAG: PilN domain-containing protein [Chloroflexi bacterium]|nr:PilN domain-containing protein [Chloroflexota bacterium]